MEWLIPIQSIVVSHSPFNTVLCCETCQLWRKLCQLNLEIKLSISYEKALVMVQVSEFTHFACTSEDINNLSHALMLKQALEQDILPAMDRVISAMVLMSEKYAGVYPASSFVQLSWALGVVKARLQADW